MVRGFEENGWLRMADGFLHLGTRPCKPMSSVSSFSHQGCLVAWSTNRGQRRRVSVHGRTSQISVARLFLELAPPDLVLCIRSPKGNHFVRSPKRRHPNSSVAKLSTLFPGDYNDLVLRPARTCAQTNKNHDSCSTFPKSDGNLGRFGALCSISDACLAS